MACLSCKEFIEFLDDYAGGGQDARVREAFERHIADCPPCADYLRDYLKTIGLVKSCCDARAAKEKAPEGLIRAILAARKEQA
jgi:anti-sigma factor RsiW